MPAWMASAARQAWSAWSGSGEGAPQKAMTASPMYLSTVPPSASTACEASSRNWPTIGTTPSPRRSLRPVKPARSANSTVSSRRSPPGSARTPLASSRRTSSVGMNLAKSARPAAMRAMAPDRRSISARREGPVRDALELEALDLREVLGDAGDRVGQEAAGAAGDQPAGREQEEGEADREDADGAVDLGQELGLGHDDRELPALEPQGRERHGVAGAVDLEPDLLLDVQAGRRAGRDPLAGGDRGPAPARAPSARPRPRAR